MASPRPTRHDDRSDEELAADYRRGGDPEVLGALYGRYLELVYGACLQYLRDAGRAEDAAMDIYEQLAGKLRDHDVNHFRPWLYRLARNHCLMILRRPASHLSPRSTSVAVDASVALGAGWSGEPGDMQIADLAHLDLEAAADREADLRRLEACADELSAGQATCIRRFYLEGASYADVAAELAWPLGRVRSAIQNGRRNLRNCVERKRAAHT